MLESIKKLFAPKKTECTTSITIIGEDDEGGPHVIKTINDHDLQISDLNLNNQLFLNLLYDVLRKGSGGRLLANTLINCYKTNEVAPFLQISACGRGRYLVLSPVIRLQYNVMNVDIKDIPVTVISKGEIIGDSLNVTHQTLSECVSRVVLGDYNHITACITETGFCLSEIDTVEEDDPIVDFVNSTDLVYLETNISQRMKGCEQYICISPWGLVRYKNIAPQRILAINEQSNLQLVLESDRTGVCATYSEFDTTGVVPFSMGQHVEYTLLYPCDRAKVSLNFLNIDAGVPVSHLREKHTTTECITFHAPKQEFRVHAIINELIQPLVFKIPEVKKEESVNIQERRSNSSFQPTFESLCDKLPLLVIQNFEVICACCLFNGGGSILGNSLYFTKIEGHKVIIFEYKGIRYKFERTGSTDNEIIISIL